MKSQFGDFRLKAHESNTIAHRYYILIGDEETWQISLAQNLWGFSDVNIGFWNTTSIGDHLAFYVTSPIKKIIGFGRIRKKFIDDELVWPDEIQFRRAIWTYRIEFQKGFVVRDWNEGIRPPKDMMLNIGRKVVSETIFNSLIRDAKMKWGVALGIDNRPNDP